MYGGCVMRTSTSALAVAVALMQFSAGPVAAGSPLDVIRDPNGHWFTSGQIGYTQFRPDRLGRVVTGPGDPLVGFDGSPTGKVTIGRRSGQWDMAFSVGGGKFSADRGATVNRYETSNLTPFGERDGDTSSESGFTSKSAHFINGNFEVGYSPDPAKTAGVQARVFGGLRFEYMKWQRQISQPNETFGLVKGTESTQFFGVGPRVGGGFEAPIFSGSPFSLFADVAGGVMLGSQEHRADRKNGAGPGMTGTNVSFAGVPFAEGEIGLGWKVIRGGELQLGYQGDWRGGEIRARNICGASDCPNTQRVDLVTYGPFLRFTMAF